MGGAGDGGDAFWTAPRLWPGETVVCLGSGPSGTVEDIERARGRARIIAINREIDRAPFADLLYCDAPFWKARGGVPAFTGLRVVLQGERQAPLPYPDIRRMRFRGDAVESDPAYLGRGGGNSGFQVVNLAAHLGASRVLLLGYDMGPGAGGELHWFGRHEQGLGNPNDRLFATWREHFAAAAPIYAAAGVEIVNCSRATALTCFPRAIIEDVL